MNSGLIVFEGSDGTGKSSLCANLIARLKKAGRNVLLFSFPGKDVGTLGQVVYDMHSRPSDFGIHEMTPASLQCLHIAAHLDAIESRILPALSEDKIVVLDRFWWSTYVYGAVGGANRNVIEKLIDAEVLAWNDVKPSILFLVDREVPLREEPMELWPLWRKEYLSLATRENANHPVRVINNTATESDALENVWKLLNEVI